MRGAGIGSWLLKANTYLRKTKLLSTVAKALGGVGVPYSAPIGTALGFLGYGRRRRYGGGLGLAGGRYLR